MDDWLLLHGFRSQATGHRASGDLGGFCRALRRLQHCSHERECGFPEKEAGPPVARVGFGKTRGLEHGVPRVLGTSAGAAAGRGAQASPIVVMGSHERAAGRDGCHASGPRRCGDESRMWALVTAHRRVPRVSRVLTVPGFQAAPTSPVRLGGEPLPCRLRF